MHLSLMSEMPLSTLMYKRYSVQDSTHQSSSIDIARTLSPSVTHADSTHNKNPAILFNLHPPKHARTYTPMPISTLSTKRSTLNKNYITNTPIINYHVTKAKQYKPIAFKDETPHNNSPSSKSNRKIRYRRSYNNSPAANYKEIKTVKDFKLQGFKAEMALPQIRAQSTEKRTRKYVAKSNVESQKIELIPSISQEVIQPVLEVIPPLKCIRLKTRLQTIQLKQQILKLDPVAPSKQYDILHPRLKSPETKHEEQNGKIRHHIRLLSNRDIYLELTDSM